MKTRLSFLLALIALMLCNLTVAQQSTVTVGNWATTSSANTTFSNNYYKNSYGQIIYPADSMGGTAGYIMALGLDCRSTASYTCDSFFVYVANTGRSTNSSTSAWIPEDSLTLVFSAANFAMPGTAGLYLIPFDSPFYYDGTSSLAVVVRKKSSAYNTNCKFAYTSLTNSFLYRQNDADSTYGEFPGTATGSHSTYLANAKFYMTTDTTSFCLPMSGLAVTGVTESSVTVAWTGEENSSFELAILEVTDGISSDDILSTNTVSDSTYTFYSLSANTNYRVYARKICSGSTTPWDSVDTRTTPIPSSLPFTESFEDDTYDAEWVLKNYDDTRNQWHIGSAVYSGDNSEGRSLYISNDTATWANAYSNTTVAVMAGRLLAFSEPGTYDISYDWRAMGAASGAYMRVMLMPPTKWSEVEARTATVTGITTTAVPDGCIAADGGSKLNLSNTWQTLSTSIDIDTAGNYYLVYYWYNSTTAAANPPAAVDNISVAESACPQPTSATVAESSITTSSASLTIEHLTADSYIIVMHASGSNAMDTIETTSNIYDFSDLASGTTFEGEVWSICGSDTSLTSASFSFTTLCATQDLPWTYGAENLWSTTTVGGVDNCWTNYNYGNSLYGWRRNTTAYEGSGSIYYYGTSTTTASYRGNDWLITPVINFEGNEEMTMYIHSGSTTNTASYQCRLAIYATPEGDDSTSIDTADFVRLTITGEDVTNNRVQFGGFTTFRQTTVQLPAGMTGPHRLAFVVDTFSYSYYIDNIYLYHLSDCPTPENVALTGVSHNKISLIWEDPEDVGSYTVTIYGENESVEDGDSQTTTDTTITLTDLSPNTTYYVVVKGECSSGSSNYTYPLAIRTACTPLTDDELPLTEDFTTYTTGSSGGYPGCWVKGTNNTTAYPYVSSSTTDGNYLYMYSTQTYYCYTTLPLTESDVSDLTLQFRIRRYTTSSYSSVVAVGLSHNPYDIATFTPYDTISAGDALGEWTNISLNLANYDAATDGAYITIYAGPGLATATTNYAYIDDLSLDLTPQCPAPEDVTVDYFTADSVTLSWTDTVNSEWIIAIVPNGLALTDAVSFTEAYESPASVGELNANTLYDAYVGTPCDDDTIWGFSVTFRTACVAVSELPYTENFESYTSGSTNNISTCWTRKTVGSTTTYPYPYTTAAINGSLGAYFYGSNTSSATIYSHASLPLFETDLNELMLTFNLKRYSSTSTSTSQYNCHLVVGVCSDPTDISTMDTLQIFDLSNEPGGSSISCEVPLAGYTGTGRYITFYAPSVPRGSATSSYNYVYIDDVEVDSMPSCWRPTDVAARNIDIDNLTLGWYGNANNYVVEYSTENNFSNAVSLTTTEDSLIITGLDDYVLYYFRVRGICGDDSTGWSTTYSVRTLLDCGNGYEYATDTLTYGTSTSYTYGLNSYPSNRQTCSWHIYTADELINLGLDTNNLIRSLAFDISTVRGSAIPFRIYMAETDITGFGTTNSSATSTSNPTDTINPSEMTLVFDGSVNFQPNQWNEIVLDTPFMHSVTHGLMVAIVRDSVLSSSSSYTYFKYGTVENYVCAYRYKSSATTTSFTSYRQKYGLNVIFNACAHIVNCAQPTELAVSDLRDATATVSWSGTAGSYEVMLSTTALNTDSLTGSEETMTVYTDTAYLTGLSASTTYYCYVRSLCNNMNSLWSNPLVFTTTCSPMTLPYIENFDMYTAGTSVTAGQTIDPCAYKGTNSSTAYPYLRTSYSYSSPNSLYMYGTSSTYSYYALPPMEDSINNLTMQFKTMKTTASNHGRVFVGVMTNPTDISTFQTVQTFRLNTITSTWTEFEIDFASYTGPEGFIAFRLGDSTDHINLDDITVLRTPSCPRPTNVTVVASSTTATVSWSTSSVASTYEVEYGIPGFTSGEGTSVVVNSDSVVLTGLQSGTDYAIHVRALCTDTSIWTPIATFTTECVPVTLPVTYDFEDFSTGSSADVPNCWYRDNDGGTYDYYPYINSSTTNAHNGSNYIYYYYSTSSSYPTIQYEVMPEIDTTTRPISNVEVEFWAKSSKNNRSLLVGVMTNPANYQTFVAVDTVTLSTTYTRYTVPLTNYNGTGSYVAIGAPRDTSTVYYNYVDDVTLQYISPCPRVYNLTASGATDSSAVLGWTDTINSSNWVIELTNLTTEAVTVVSANDNPYTVTGLMPATNYSFRVAPVCASGDTAFYNNEPMRFGTAQTPATLPYLYDFEDGTEWENWQTASNNAHGFYRGNVAQYNNSYCAYMSIDSGATHSMNMLTTTNAVAYRDIDFGETPVSVRIDFKGYYGGTIDHNYDGMSVAMVDPTTYVECGSTGLVTPWGHTSVLNHRYTIRHDTLWDTHTLYLDGVSGVQRIAVLFFTQGTGGSSAFENNPPAFDSISIVAMPCARPVITGIDMDDQQPTQATVNWNGDSTDSYVVVYRLRNDTTNASLRSDTAVGLSHTITGLTPISYYNVWVRHICSDTLSSDLSGAWWFRTPCVPISVADTMVEDFESTTAAAWNSVEGYLPDCWTSWSTGSNGLSPHVTDSGQYSYCNSGRNAITLTSGTSTTYGNDSYVKLPDIIEPTNSLTMAFYMCTESSSFGVLEVGYLTGDDYENDFVAVKTIPASSATYHSGNGPQSGHGIFDTVSFDSVPAGNFSLAFHWNHTSSYYSCCIDDVTIWSSNTCSDPIIVSTDLTYESAEITLAAADVMSNQLAYGTDPTALNDTVVSTTDVLSISGLTPNTTYYYAVRKICDSVSTSVWVEGSFTTDELPCMAPSAVASSNVSFNSADITWTSEGEETAWEVAVFNATTNLSYQASSTSLTADGLTAGVTYQACVRALCGSNANFEGPWSDTITFTTDICQPVTNVTVDNVTGTTAQVSWTNGSNGNGTWTINYGTSGFSQGLGTVISVSTNPYTLTNLESETTYDVYVKSNCTDDLSSVWSVPVATFETESGEGIDNVSTARFSLYPNPATSTVTIEAEDGETIEIVDMNGRVVYSTTFTTSSTTIDVSSLAQGAYFVKVTGQSGTGVKKLIVK